MENTRKPTDEVFRALSGAVRHLQPGQTVRVALSGGLDSVVLLHGLVQWREREVISLSALHVNHQLQSMATQWSEFCGTLCRQWQVPLVTETVTIVRQPGQSLEAEARRARYDAYRRQLVDWVVLAHHQDDQAETLLLQLLRGAGIPGLQGMPMCRTLDDGTNLLRPLLGLSRATLERYAAHHGLSWVEDPSNREVRFTRNYLRHRVAPLLDEIAPSWRRTLARSATHLAAAQRLLDDMAQQDYHHCQRGDGIDGRLLRELSSERGINLLRWWARKMGAPPCSTGRWEDWWHQCRAGPDRHPRLRWGGWVVFRERGVWYGCRETDVVRESTAGSRDMLE
ncbi:MAG: tRNA lysidine(34) synthetase TilS [Betaproteobacteria bacterium]|jgi:tRNA(Ile)-lysidine synthetase, N-terminal domain|nr:tRNA lysidine(34) synthetase TilS [Betaproteobacteria bacterium]